MCCVLFGILTAVWFLSWYPGCWVVSFVAFCVLRGIRRGIVGVCLLLSALACHDNNTSQRPASFPARPTIGTRGRKRIDLQFRMGFLMHTSNNFVFDLLDFVYLLQYVTELCSLCIYIFFLCECLRVDL